MRGNTIFSFCILFSLTICSVRLAFVVGQLICFLRVKASLCWLWVLFLTFVCHWGTKRPLCYCVCVCVCKLPKVPVLSGCKVLQSPPQGHRGVPLLTPTHTGRERERKRNGDKASEWRRNPFTDITASTAQNTYPVGKNGLILLIAILVSFFIIHFCNLENILNYLNITFITS